MLQTNILAADNRIVIVRQNGNRRMANGSTRHIAEPSSCYSRPLVYCQTLSGSQFPASPLTFQPTDIATETHRILTTSTWNHSPVAAPFRSQVLHSPLGSAGTPGQSLSLMGLCECQCTRPVNPLERHQYEGPISLIGGTHVHK